jgi:tagatose 1,6-diphosphate aldolase GatY/KbaY
MKIGSGCRTRRIYKMALVTTKRLLQDAQAGGYAIGAFNVENMEMVQAVVAAAEEMNSPVIMQTTPGTVKYADLRYFYENVRTAAEEASVPVVMHLDHGNSFELAMQALRTGYTSIMIDGSRKPFEENIALTKAVVDACHPSGIPVEAELGKVGGKEDDLEGGDDSPYTDPQQAAEFVERTGVDSLAIAVGTAHGVYKVTPKLDVERITAVRQFVTIPLVLHGTSGVPDEQVAECVRRGMCKVNYATDLRIAFTKGVKSVLAETPDVFDPKKYNAAGREEVKKYVMQKMQVVGSVGKAAQYKAALV